MRQRKIKNLEEKILCFKRWYVADVSEVKGKWEAVFENRNDLFLELGSGKGQFLICQAEKRRDRNYIGVEGRASVAFRALQKLEEAGLENVRFADGFVNDPETLFSESEISGIYLNFSDPWPKGRHAHRRLTHRNYLIKYHKILKPGGFVELKTDSAELFAFTESEVKEAAGMFRITESSSDLHHSDYNAKEITSEYEDKFLAAGKNIYYVRLVMIV